MFSTGYLTVVLYTISVVFYLVGMLYPSRMVICAIAGTVFFVGATLVIGIMTVKRIKS